MKKLFAICCGLIYFVVPNIAYALPGIQTSEERAATLALEEKARFWNPIYGTSILILALLFLFFIILIILRLITRKSIKNPIFLLITVIVLLFLLSAIFSYFFPSSPYF